MNFEVKIIEFLQAGRNPFFDAAFQIISEIGSILGIVFACILFLVFRRKLCFWFLFSYGFVNVSVNVIKRLVQRIRPFNLTDSIVNIGKAVTDYSFPSGHTACATAIAIFVGYMLFTHYQSRGMKASVVIGCAVYVGLVAVSRMYLGKHYLTDLLAGFAISAAICAVGLTLMYFYDKSKKQKKNKGVKS